MEWGASIIRAIEQCRVMVLIFSGNANQSQQIRREGERAVNKGRSIVTMRIEDIEPDQSLEYFIGSLHWLDALTKPLAQHLTRLTDAVAALIDLPAPPVNLPAPPKWAARPMRDEGGPPSSSALSQPGMRWAMIGGAAVIAVALVYGVLTTLQKPGSVSVTTTPGSVSVTATRGEAYSVPSSQQAQTQSAAKPPPAQTGAKPQAQELVQHKCEAADLDACSAWIRLDPNSIDAYVSRGYAYYIKHLYDQAIADYTKAITLKPNSYSAYYLRGAAYRDKGLYDQAIADYTKMVTLFPTDDNYYYARADVYEKKGLRDQAITDYRAALRIAPKNWQALDGLKRLGAAP